MKPDHVGFRVPNMRHEAEFADREFVRHKLAARRDRADSLVDDAWERLITSGHFPHSLATLMLRALGFQVLNRHY